MARFKTNDIGCKWHEAALPQKIIPYCAREFIKLWYNIRNAWLCSFTLRLDVSRDLRLVHCCNYSQQMWELLNENTNAYTLQKTGNLLDVSKKELEQVIGLFSMTGLVSNLWNRRSICICCRHEQNTFLNIVALQHWWTIHGRSGLGLLRFVQTVSTLAWWFQFNWRTNSSAQSEV